jgi:pre-mRNA-splicing factor CWC22
LPSNAGGVYIPPFKMRKMLEELQNESKESEAHQKYMWEMLRKSINGIVNKVNVSNISNIIMELFNENLMRGKGLLARAILKAQMASPSFTHVYVALLAAVNTKLPEIARIVINRVITQFKKAYRRKNKLVCKSSVSMIAHLVNQQVVNELLAL